MRTLNSSIVTSILGLLLIAGCGGTGGGGGHGGMGTLEIDATDAPFPATTGCLSAANIVIDRVEAQREDSFELIPLQGAVDGKVTLNLLELRAEVAAKLAVGGLPTGTYERIWVHIVETSLVFTDSTVQTFKVPSGMQSGLKIDPKPPIVIAAGQVTPLRLDFDLSESFHVTGTGNSPTCDDLKDGHKVIFHPVVQAMNLNENGVVAGTVTQGGTAAADVEVTAFVAGTVVDALTTPILTTFSSPSGLSNVALGEYALLLEPGSYDLYVRPQGAPDRILSAANVVATAGEITEQDLSLP